jgi:hypothetical protein
MTIQLMKRFVLSGALLASAAIAPSASAADALRVSVPFDFIAGGQTMPAGEYIVAKMSSSGLIMVQGRANKRSAALITMPSGYSGAASADPGLTFNSTGTRHVLSSVMLGSGETRVIDLK